MKTLLTLAAIALGAGSAQAVTTTMTAASAWATGSWDNGVPAAGDDAIIDTGVTATANGAVATWSGELTLQPGSRLVVSGTTAEFTAIDGATTINLNNGLIADNFKTRTIAANIVLAGGGGFTTQGQPNTGWNNSRRFAGEISGNGGFSTSGSNHMGYFFNVTNPFTGGLVLNSNDRHGVQFNAPGSAGLGDVTVNPAANGRSAAIRLGADDVFAPSAVLTLNGAGWNNSTGGFGDFAGVFNGSSVRIDMQTFNATVAELFIDGVQQDAGDYTGTSGDWIRGTGILTVMGGGGPDVTPPAISSLNPANGATDVAPSANLVVTFNEEVMEAGGNLVIREIGGAEVATIGIAAGNVSIVGATVSIDPSDDLAPGTGYYVEIAADALEDLAGNPFPGITGDATWRFTTGIPDLTAPSIASLSPANAATGVAPSTDLLVTFDEDVTAGTGDVVIKELPGGAVVESITIPSGNVTISGAQVTINPTSDLAPGTGYYVEIAAGAIFDLTGNPFSGITGSATWNFTTGTPPVSTTLTAIGTWATGAWSDGVPVGSIGAIIAPGVTGTANGVVPTWNGSLTLQPGSQLNIAGTTAEFTAIDGATSIVLNNAFIGDNFKTRTIAADIIVSGGSGFTTQGQPNTGWNNSRRFDGVISGDGGFSISGSNHMGYFFNVANPFTGGLVLNSNDRYGVQFNAPGSAGVGDVTVNPSGNGRSAAIRLGADNVFAPSAKLTLNGTGWNSSTGGFGDFAGIFNGSVTRIDMQTFNATVASLIIDDVTMPPGSYSGTDGDWIAGTGILTVTGGAGFAITAISYSPAGNLVTLTWDSREGETYSVKVATDLFDWSADLDDGVDADAGESTTREFDLSGLANDGRVFFRVERLPAN